MSQIHTHHQYNPEKDMDKRFIGFTIATAIGLTAATAAGGVGLTGLGLAVGAGLTGAALFGATKLLPKSPKAQELPALPQSPQLSGGPGSAESKAKSDTLAKRQGIARNRTNYTSPLGLTPLNKSELNLKTLMGA